MTVNAAVMCRKKKYLKIYGRNILSPVYLPKSRFILRVQRLFYATKKTISNLHTTGTAKTNPKCCQTRRRTTPRKTCRFIATQLHLGKFVDNDDSKDLFALGGVGCRKIWAWVSNLQKGKEK